MEVKFLTRCFEQLARAAALMAAQNVEDDDAWFERRDQEQIDLCTETLSIDRAFDHADGDDAVVQQSGDERRHKPFP